MVVQWNPPVRWPTASAAHPPPISQSPGCPPTDGGNYQLVVTNIYGSATSTSAVLTVLSPPSVITSPTNATVTAGLTTTFTVGTVGTAPLSYQWYSQRGGHDKQWAIHRHDHGDLNIFSTLTNDSATYHVIVTNNYGSATSSVANLTVLATIKITSLPSSQAILGWAAQANFSAGAIGSSPVYQWYFNGAALTDGGRITPAAQHPY